MLLSIVSLTFIQNIIAEDKISSSPTVISVATKQPEEGKVYPIAVIGAGAAGSMAATRAVLNNNEVLLFAGANQERRRSRGNWVRTVDNIPGFSKYTRTVLELRNEVLEELVQSPLGHNLYLIEESVLSIEKENDCFKLIDGTGRIYHAQYLVMATGVMDQQPHIQGEIYPILSYANAQTIAYCIICDGHRSYGKKTVVIGHADSAASVSLLLSDKYNLQSMIILTNGQANQFSLESLKKMEEKNIKILEQPIHEVLGADGVLAGFKLENGDVVESEIGFVSLGLRPNNQLALQLGAQVDDKGLVVTDINGETSVANLFVVGDLRANSLKQIYTGWQHAVEALQLINKRIRTHSEQKL